MTLEDMLPLLRQPLPDEEALAPQYITTYPSTV